MLGLDIAHMHAKSEHSSFSHSREMVGAYQMFNGSRDQTMPLSQGHIKASTGPGAVPNVGPLQTYNQLTG